MKFIVDCSPKRIDGYHDLIKLNNREINPFCARMTRFTFNLHSVSFELVEVPWSENGLASVLRRYPPELLHENARVVKVRCVAATVFFSDFAHCLPQFNDIYFYEANDSLYVELENYARIHCNKAIVRVEEYTNDSSSVWSLYL
jgi:hypothetical protein